MALKAPIANGVVTSEMIEMGLADALVNTAKYIRSLSLESIDNEIILLSCLLINTLSQKDIVEAKNLAEFLSEVLSPKQIIFFRNQSNSELLKTNLSKERWGLDPDLIKTDH